MTIHISIPKSRWRILIHDFGRILDPEGNELVSMPTDLGRLILRLVNPPELHQTVNHREILQTSLDRLHDSLITMGRRLTYTDKLADGTRIQTKGMSDVARARFTRPFLSEKIELLQCESYKGVFLGLKILMRLLEDRGNVDADQEALWEDIQRFMDDIWDTLRSITKKVENLEAGQQ